MFTTFIRTIILYFIIIFGIRIMGKRQVGELEPSELVMSLLLADLASVPMQDLGIPMISGVVPIITLLSLSTILSVLTVKSINLRVLLCGKPSIIIRNGVIDQREMSKNRITIDELLEELRGQGFNDISKLKYAVLETNGKISILPYANQVPPTAEMMNLTPEETGLPIVLISDGNLLRHNLKKRGIDEAWIEKFLKKQHCQSISEVFMLTIDEDHNTYFTKKSKA